MRRLLTPLLLAGLLSGLVAGCAGTETIDRPAASHSAQPAPRLGSSAAAIPLSGAITLGQTLDEAGQPHALVLNLDPSVQQALAGDSAPFAVVSGASALSVTGDAASGAWRFAVDSGATGAAAPIVVLKYARGTTESLAGNPQLFTAGTELNADVAATSARLQALIASVLAAAQLPGGEHFAQLAGILQDTSWSGVLIFGASATVPGEVLGQSTGALAGTDVASVAIGFTRSMVDSSPGTDGLFGTIDHAAAPSLRAGFVNGALTSFALG